MTNLIINSNTIYDFIKNNDNYYIKYNNNKLYIEEKKIIKEYNICIDLIDLKELKLYFKYCNNIDINNCINLTDIEFINYNYDNKINLNINFNMFTKLKKLKLHSYIIDDLNLSLNNLEYLTCNYCIFNNININNCINLIYINIINEYNINLNINFNIFTKLKKLKLESCTIDNFNLSLNNLEHLICDGCTFNNININDCINLIYLAFINCYKLHNLNINKSLKLETLLLYVEDEGIKKDFDIDFNIFKELKTLNISGYNYNKLYLDLINLKELYCSSCNLKDLNINKCINLNILECADNKLYYLNINNLINLKEINCEDNNINILNLSNINNDIELLCDNIIIIKNDYNIDYDDDITLINKKNCFIIDDNNINNLNYVKYNNNELIIDNIDDNEIDENEINVLIVNVNNLESLIIKDNYFSYIDLNSLINLRKFNCKTNYYKDNNITPIYFINNLKKLEY